MAYSHREITGITKFLKLSSIVHWKLFDATSVFLAKAVHLIAFFLSFLSPALSTTSEVIFTISNYILKEEKKDLRSESIAIMRKKPRYKIFWVSVETEDSSPTTNFVVYSGRRWTILIPCINACSIFLSKFFWDLSISAATPQQRSNIYYHPDSNNFCLKEICWTQKMKCYFYLTSN